MCAAVGVVIILAMLLPLGWMLADIVLTARFLVEPAPKPRFVVYLYIIGYGKITKTCSSYPLLARTKDLSEHYFVPAVLPLLMCGITMGTLAVVQDSFLDLFAYPDL